MKNKFAQRLNELRLSNGLTLEEFAMIFNTHKPTIWRYEKGENLPDVEFAQKVANHFNVSLDWLIGRSKYKDCYSEQIEKASETLQLPSDYIRVIREAYEAGVSSNELREMIQLALKFKGK